MAAPIKHTCPDIDKVIKRITLAMSEIFDNIEDKSTLKFVISQLEAAIDGMEELRNSNDILRSWGKELEEQITEHENYIDELESNLNEVIQQV